MKSTIVCIFWIFSTGWYNSDTLCDCRIYIISWGILKGKGWALISAVILIMGYGRRCNKYRWEHSCLYYTRNYSMYLFRPNVTSYFGRVKIQTPWCLGFWLEGIGLKTSIFKNIEWINRSLQALLLCIIVLFYSRLVSFLLASR
jgi:hypothetical protein